MFCNSNARNLSPGHSINAWQSLISSFMSSTYNRKDHFYQKAKDEGYRSRAAYKLIELDKKYQLLRPGIKVIDLGAWPGGWLQVVSERLGAGGIVVGIDLVEIDEVGVPNVKTLTGDVSDEANLDKAKELAGGSFDLVLSDMSPKLSGIKEADRYGAVACAELALFAAQKLLNTEGNLVIKVFKSNETEAFVKTCRPLFNKVIRAELDSTRKTSNEFYIVCLGLKK